MSTTECRNVGNGFVSTQRPRRLERRTNLKWFLCLSSLVAVLLSSSTTLVKCVSQDGGDHSESAHLVYFLPHVKARQLGVLDHNSTATWMYLSVRLIKVVFFSGQLKHELILQKDDDEFEVVVDNQVMTKRPVFYRGVESTYRGDVRPIAIGYIHESAFYGQIRYPSGFTINLESFQRIRAKNSPKRSLAHDPVLARLERQAVPVIVRSTLDQDGRPMGSPSPFESEKNGQQFLDPLFLDGKPYTDKVWKKDRHHWFPSQAQSIQQEFHETSLDATIPLNMASPAELAHSFFPGPSECQAEVVIIPETYNAFNRSYSLVVSEMRMLFEMVSQVFERTDFDNDTIPEGIRVRPVKFNIFTSPQTPGYPFQTRHSHPYPALVEFSKRHIQEHCISVAIFAQRFEKRVNKTSHYGAAWMGHPFYSTGVCAKETVHQFQGRLEKYVLNTAVVSLLRIPNQLMDRQDAALVLTHVSR